ncbi:Homeodomain-like protein [Cordyceps fumosorosea ARSEF 2679]|uniref:Homeodomain-like protein n=1 Tax=Cordyceps fumosorosea (strain ARSEF 2679) TaxID=1081104 RepID=A0A167ZFT0_CORFA|nr:Homeodomain-like protein [Cordyceps fumosorosea ARSEF 2679]OAA67464.1 Homeodomain-like protein [Cordyceps fumosorosea ARSEF 2679]
MSSMFKKKGAPAFKPKIPSARARPAAPAPAPAPVVKPVEPPVSIDEVVEELPVEAPELQRPSDSVLEPQPADRFTAPEPSQPKPRRRSSAASTSKPIQDAATYKQLAEAARSNIEAISEDTPVESPVTVAKEVDSAPATRRQTRQRRASQAAQTQPPAEIRQLETPPSTEQQVSTSASESQPEAQAEAPAVAAPKATRSRRRAAVTAEAAAEDSEATTARPRKRTRKAAVIEGEAAPVAAKPRKRSTAAAAADKAPARARRARSTTPDDSENKMVDLQTLKMSDLTRDLHIGKKFSRHDELRERERQARVQAKLSKEGLTLNGDGSRSGTPLDEQVERIKAGTPGSSTPGANGEAAAAPSGSGGGGGGGPAPAGPQFRIVDGQIVVDQSSLIMDRHARAAAAHAGEDMETIEENDFTRLITSSSFMTTSKLRGPNLWTDAETELFYRGLAMFGTEFQMISHMFPGKQRRHVKLKFNREERRDPARVDAALVGEKTTRMDLDEYRALTGARFEPVEDIMAEHRRVEEGYEAERKRVADEQAEIMRKKREELFAEDDEADAKKKKKGRGGKKGKQAVQYGLNGEPIVNEG